MPTSFEVDQNINAMKYFGCNMFHVELKVHPNELMYDVVSCLS